MNAKIIRLLVIDNHTLYRCCLVSFLTGQDDIIVVGETGSADSALNMSSELQPDLVLLNIDWEGQDSFSLAEKILTIRPHCAVILLSASPNREQMLRAIQIGANGYVVQEVKPDDLVTVMRRVMDGDMVFPRTFLADQIRLTIEGNNGSKSSLRQHQRELQGKQLTEREVEILRLATDALSDKEIALKLSISVHTIKNHMKSIRKKLDATNRVEVTMKGLQLGIIPTRIQHIVQQQPYHTGHARAASEIT